MADIVKWEAEIARLTNILEVLTKKEGTVVALKEMHAKRDEAVSELRKVSHALLRLLLPPSIEPHCSSPSFICGPFLLRVVMFIHATIRLLMMC